MENKIIIGLIIFVLILGVILGIKIYSTQNSEPQNYISTYNETILDKNNENKSESNKKTASEILDNTMSSAGVIVILLILFLLICMYKIYFNLGINPTLIIVNIISFILAIILVNTLETIALILSGVYAVTMIVITVKMYITIGVSPWLLLAGIIPVVGQIIALIVSIVATCRLADYFGEDGAGFKLGLIFLPFIFLPILAFKR